MIAYNVTGTELGVSCISSIFWRAICLQILLSEMEVKGLLLQVTHLSSGLNWSKTPVCLTPTCVPLVSDVLPAIESIRPSLSVRVLEAVHSIGVSDMSSI